MMAARSKKRRRADGSIAGKRLTSQAGRRLDTTLSERVFEALEEVPTETLRIGIDIAFKYKPVDGTRPDEGFEWDYDSMFGALTALAEAYGVDDDSLGGRTDMLMDFLSLPQNHGYRQISPDGTIAVRPDLLKFAASSPVDNSNKPLIWTSEDEVPGGEK